MVFTAKYLKSDYYNQSIKGIPLYKTFAGTDPPMSLYQKLKTIPNSENADNLNVNMVMMSSPNKDHVVSISDVAGEQEWDINTMETIGKIKWNDELSDNEWNMLSCAHPNKIADDPSLYNYLMDMNMPGNLAESGKKFKYHFYKVNPLKSNERYKNNNDKFSELKREIIASYPVDEHRYVHHFSQTPNYIIVVEFPLFWDVKTLITSSLIKGALKFKPEEGVNIKVISTKKKQLVKEYKLKHEHFFAFHHAGAYEENGKIILDMATYDDIGYHLDSFILTGRHANNTHDLPPGTVRRIIIPIDSKTNEQPIVKKLGTVDLELPIVNQNFKGRKYKYIFAHSKSVSIRDNGCESGQGCGGKLYYIYIY